MSVAQVPGSSPRSAEKRPSSKGHTVRASDLSARVTTPPGDDDIVTISRFGELLLVVQREDGGDATSFRVDSASLKGASPYFNRLLSPDLFQEGNHVSRRHADLRAKHENLADAPVEELPRVAVSYIGQTSTLKSARPLMTDFLRILHSQDIVTAVRNPPSINIANLAVVADRFDAIPALSQWSISKNILPPITNTTPVYDEEIYRQRLLTCLLLQRGPRLLSYSNHLVLSGSTKWIDEEHGSNGPLWWDLPSGVEEELRYRHECILRTVLSLQDYLVGLYTSRERQCRLGYDTSPQCDSFQLGEFVKFLTRIGTLQLVAADEESIPIPGDVRKLIKELRACPSYQIDSHHNHCGPKKHLTSGLDFIQEQLSDSGCGICVQCWKKSDSRHFWSEAKPMPIFNHASTKKYHGNTTPGACGNCNVHEYSRDLFTAEDKAWATRLGLGNAFAAPLHC